MTGYGQYCPVAKAMEVLDERWTMLIVRELLLGSTRFNDLRRGVPKMSPALLSKRLHSLERAGILTRTTKGRNTAYHLTQAGQELVHVVDALGEWGLRWVPELGDEDYDPHLLMWDIRRTVPVDVWPRTRTVIAFDFDDIATRDARWWVVVREGEVDICDLDPGYEPTARVSTGLRTLTRLWRGEVNWIDAMRDGRARIDAPAEVRRLVPTWLGQSTLAAAVKRDGSVHQ